ncbi:hypothetical protein JXL21_05235 [Candidatus Bathyarchaeota archaeon]|nr:hypothetical protein [Candidatus Bathyarchaeota archaeon]
MGVNPHGICTWGDDAQCSDCDLKHRLFCRWERRHLVGFLSIMLTAFAAGFVGMYITGRVIGSHLYLYAFVAFLLVFFNVVETWILCRHCPYYARSGRTLHCLANHGCLKLWRYEPKPATALERNAMRASFALFFGYPFVVSVYGLWRYSLVPAASGLSFIAYAGLIIVILVAEVSTFMNLRLYFCPHCVNFSCPLNRTPEDVKGAYIDRNPVLREAWAGR